MTINIAVVLVAIRKRLRLGPVCRYTLICYSMHQHVSVSVAQINMLLKI